jgi:hypothetical protein
MITHAYTAVDRENIKHHRDKQVGLAEKKQRGNGAQMKDSHENSCDPDHA